MLKIKEAINIILENTSKLGCESVDILLSLNRILAEDVYSRENIPPFNNSAMDGFAVVSSIIKGSSDSEPSVLNVVGNIAAGYITDDIVQGNSAIKIMTGAPVPIGADTVVPVEFTQVDGNVVKILKETVQWKNIRFAGEDVKIGELVISKGKLIRVAEVGMLAALNITDVKVTQKPKISILATGDELVSPGEKLLPGKIRNINSYSLYAQVLKNGCEPINLGVARDNKIEIMHKLDMAKNSDILIISGGVSAGDYDFVKKALLEMGMKEKFWRVAIKPGKPVLFGLMENTLVFGLPGNPVSSMVAFQEFVLPAIYKLQGRNKKPGYELGAIFEGNIKKEVGQTQFVIGKTFEKGDKLCVRIAGPQSSGVFSTLVQGDCFIIVPDEVTEVKSGEKVLIQITDEIGD